MPIRLIHTADIHLDMCFAGAGFPPGFAQRRRQSLRDVFSRIVERAGEWPADALLIAGDVFELDRAGRDTANFLAAVFEGAPHVPVFIAPGNHDPCSPHSPYVTEDWPDNVHIFRRPQWERRDLVHVPLSVHGFGFDGPDVSHNPFGELAVPHDDGRVHVAVAHGSARGHQPEGKAAYAPFDVETAAPAGLRYLALGHFHGMTEARGAHGGRVFYSGAPEGHGFGETGMRGYLEVLIEDGSVDVKPVPSAQAVYHNHRLDVSGMTNAQEVVGAIRALPRESGKTNLVRVTLTGAAAPALQEAIPAVRESVGDVFAYLEVVDQTVPEDDYEDLAQDATSLGMFLQQINKEIEDAGSEARRAMLLRARQVGLFAYRGQPLPIRGLEGS